MLVSAERDVALHMPCDGSLSGSERCLAAAGGGQRGGEPHCSCTLPRVIGGVRKGGASAKAWHRLLPADAPFFRYSSDRELQVVNMPQAV
jgi:hypothetical protein